MSRPTHISFDSNALLHNIKRVAFFAPQQKIIAMVKANAYGCGIQNVVPILKDHVDAFGVTCTDEAIAIRQLSPNSRCILFHGAYSANELDLFSQFNLECVIHQPAQLQWLCHKPQPKPLKVWIKINTGMNRLGFSMAEVPAVIAHLKACQWISPDIGLVTHFASADEPAHLLNQQQLRAFNELRAHYPTLTCSAANSAAIMSFPASHFDYVRPGIMLYGISPFAQRSGHEFGLKPVMHLASKVITIYTYPAHSPVGYQSTWQSDKPSRIGVVPIGYGDGYPRHLRPGASVWLAGRKIPIVGRVSMDLLTVDLTDCPEAEQGTEVELWGNHLTIEEVAETAGTIAYELLCQITSRVARDE